VSRSQDGPAAQGGRQDPAEVREAGSQVTRAAQGGGLAALPDLPLSGRPSAVGRKELAKAMPGMSRAFAAPDRARSMIADVSGAACRHATVRRIMRASGLPHRVARLVHADRASRRAVAVWWSRTKRRIARPGRRGFAVGVQDEPVFAHDAGARPRSPVGVSADVPHAGSHHKVVACGAIAEDGRWPFRTRKRLGAARSCGARAGRAAGSAGSPPCLAGRRSTPPGPAGRSGVPAAGTLSWSGCLSARRTRASWRRRGAGQSESS